MNGDPVLFGENLAQNNNRRANNQASGANDPTLLTSFKSGAQNNSKNSNRMVLRSGKELLQPNG